MSQNIKSSYNQKHWQEQVGKYYPDVIYHDDFQGLDKTHPWDICKRFSNGEEHPELMCFTYYMYKDEKISQCQIRNLTTPEQKLDYVSTLTPDKYNEYVVEGTRMLQGVMKELLAEEVEKAKKEYENNELNKIKQQYSSQYDYAISLLESNSFTRVETVLMNLLIGFITSLMVYLITASSDKKGLNLIIIIIAAAVGGLLISSIWIVIKNRIKIKKLDFNK